MSNVTRRIYSYNNKSCDVLMTNSNLQLANTSRRESKVLNRHYFYGEILNSITSLGQKSLVLFSKESYQEYGLSLLEFLRKRHKHIVLVLDDYCEKTVNQAFLGNDDIRVIFAVGGGQVVNSAKIIGANYSLPVVVLLTQPDSDSFLTDFAVLRKDTTLSLVKCQPPKVICFDKGANYTTRQIKCAIGFIAKNILSVFELKYLDNSAISTLNDLESQLKNCMLVDFLEPTADNIELIFRTLAMISLIRNSHKSRLFFAVDALIYTTKGKISPTQYAYPLSCLITALYQNMLSEKDLSFTLPLSTLNGFHALISCGFNPNYCLTYEGNSPISFSAPSLSNNLNALTLALNLLEPQCYNTIIPLSKQQLLDSVISALLIFQPTCLLSDLYQAGYIA